MDFHHDGEPSSAFTASEGRPRTSKTRRDSASASASLSRPLKPVPQLRRRRTEAGISGRPEAPETIVIGKSITYPPPPDSQFRRIWYYIDGPQLMRLPVAPPPEDVLPEFKWSVPGLTRYYGKRYPLLFVWGLYATALVCWLGIICIPLSSGAGYAVKEPPSTSTEGAGRPPPLITIPINYTVYIFVLFPFYVLSGTLCVGYYFHSYSPEFWLLRAWDFFFCFIPMMVIPVAANHIMYKYQPEIIESKIWVFWTIILGCSWGICYIGILNFRKQRKWTVFTHSRRASLASSPDGAAAKGASSDTENPRLSTTEKSRGSMARHHHHDPRCSPEAAADPYGKPEPMPFRTMFWMLGHIVQLLCLYYAGQVSPWRVVPLCPALESLKDACHHLTF
ncbi:uncharacterized protein EV422DRAFT_524968 [Fimicolochytrium jonesii]|uniref:uncharacterized protein n=1 Tax=Fimicolochytrium jonesii TaxID=1396493 RepID=UPI0022FE93D6|nr:uncharacterized protein EV422DRAFT_524968 [Fimicolochytrium jonesii]KAI8822679.1 hypothetical protein EV422DRAFT_524968 [Fimicolochytrium jonesii]